MTTRTFDRERFLAMVPREPGCYLMKNHEGEVVYIGKAKNLRARLSSYFRKTSDTRYFVRLLDRVLGDIDTILCSNDKEAVILENELIKKHQPRYNVELKDDKNFLHIRIDRSRPYPRLEVVRRPRKNDGAVLFGPYHSASSIRSTMRIVNRHFSLRTCPDSVFKNRSRPCLEYQIQRCPGPCVLPYPEEKYREHIEDVILFLSGKTKDLLDTLKKKMKAASDTREYEVAAHHRDQIAAIKKSLTPQEVFLKRAVDMDVIGLYREGALTTIQLLMVRQGSLVGSQGFQLGQQEIPDAEVVSGFLQQHYAKTTEIPAEVVLPLPMDLGIALGAWLTEKRGMKVRVHTPSRGSKRKLVSLANRNAKQSFVIKQKNEEEAVTTLEGLRKRLQLKNLPTRIECFDISNFQGRESVASQVCFIGGQPARQEYRHYKIRSGDEPDDFRMIHEVTLRRFQKVVQGGEPPDLVIIDGGKGQLNAALRALDTLGIVGVDLIGLAKSRVEKGRASRSSPPSHSPERVFIPGARDPIVLDQNSSELFLLTRLRDEAHRFAITHHRSLRRKRTLRSPLDDIPGIGPSRKKNLIRHFGSLKKIQAATFQEIASISGIGSEIAANIKKYLP